MLQQQTANRLGVGRGGLPVESRESQAAELRSLRSRRGLTLGRLEQCPALCGEDNAARALERITAALAGLKQDREVLALAYALAVKGTGVTLRARRDDYASTLETWVSHDTLEVWENKAIAELVSALAGQIKPMTVIQTGHVVAGALEFTELFKDDELLGREGARSEISLPFIGNAFDESFLRNNPIPFFALSVIFDTEPKLVWASIARTFEMLYHGNTEVFKLDITRHPVTAGEPTDSWSVTHVFNNLVPTYYYTVHWLF